MKLLKEKEEGECDFFFDSIMEGYETKDKEDIEIWERHKKGGRHKRHIQILTRSISKRNV